MTPYIKVIKEGPSIVVLRKGKGDGEDGRWVTMNGSPVFIREGQLAEDAAKERFGGKPKPGSGEGGAAETVKFSNKLEEEIQYQIDNFADSAEAGETLSRTEAIQRMMDDMDDPELVASEFKKELQDFGVSIGVWKPYTKEQLANITISTSSGRRARKYEFRRGDRYYIFESWKPLMGKDVPELGSKI